MIIVQTPLRLEFLGGSTDISSFYSKHTGRVLCSAIDKYIYVIVKKSFDGNYYFTYDKKESAKKHGDIKHPIVREVLKYFKIDKGLEIVSLSDITKGGSGLGSSSSFTVGLVHAVSLLSKKKFSKRELAETACHIEIDLLGKPIGKQDQYAVAFGGINYLRFRKNGWVDVNKIKLNREQLNNFHKSLLMFYTGKTRSTSKILSRQEKRAKANHKYLRKMSGIVLPGKRALLKGDLKKFSEILYDEWSIKKHLDSEISNNKIENMYQSAVSNGAWGGRLSGAGGSGFLSLFADPSTHQKIKDVLIKYQNMSCKVEETGSTILVNQD